MKILVVGGGGREHALAWKLKQSPKVSKIYCAPGNAGTDQLGENIDIAADDIEGLRDFAVLEEIDLTVVGPEQALVLGITDLFKEKGLLVFGPSAKAANIEGSKVFCKNLMQKYAIPTAEFKTFWSADSAKDYVKGKDRLVVKAEGLAAGKGVILCHSQKEAEEAIDLIMRDKAFGSAGEKILIESFLEGQEISFLALTDGDTVLPLEGAQDHKTALDGNQGPNTGGMGAFSPSPLFTPEMKEQVMREIMLPTVQALKNEGCPYQGVLYAGLMLTQTGPKVLEFNARFGDPETQVLMARLDCDLLPLLLSTIDHTLEGQKLIWKDDAAICVVMAAKGYPGKYEKGRTITGIEDAETLPEVKVFHAGTKVEKEKVLTAGGRVLGVTALGENLSVAIERSYKALQVIEWDGIHFRTDIGRSA